MTHPVEPELPMIGEAGQPVRVVAFSSGGFDTAMDLGVMHALLVIQGKSPDAVVGISAGALNAAALAEVLQQGAGPNARPQDKQRAQVARFREVLDCYVNAPSELADAYLPDIMQIDAGRSLEPLHLPIHNKRERDGRTEEVNTRQGFVRFFNFLLQTRVSFSTLTRFTRRFLGVRAASTIRSRAARYTFYAVEVIRSWSLLGSNLHRIAELALELAWGPLFRGGRKTFGVTAARVLYARRWFRNVRVAFGLSTVFVILTALWLTATAIPIAMVAGVAVLLSRQGVAVWVAAGCALVIAVGVGSYLFSQTGAWRQLTVTDGHPVLHFLGELCLETLEVAGLVLLYLGVPLALVAVGVALTSSSLAFAHDRFLEVLLYTIPVVVALGVIPAVVVGYLVGRVGGDYPRRFLQQFDMADGLLSRHPLRDRLVRFFDPEFYGPRNMDDVVERSLKNEYEPTAPSPERRVIRDYECRHGTASPRPDRIAVGLIVANVGTGGMEIAPDNMSLVDGLYAATASTPWLPPVKTTEKMFVDASKITSDPTAGALEFLRNRVNPSAPVLHIYSVSPLPFSSPTLREDDAGQAPVFLNLVDVAQRALLLQRFRDASLERRLTELYTKTMPAGSASQTYDEDTFLRAWVTPVEPNKPLEVNQRLFDATSKEGKREAITTAVAEGCRAALQVMIRASQGPISGAPGKESFPTCRSAVTTHFQNIGARPLPLLSDLDPNNPRPNDEQSGLPEVCARCRFTQKGPVGPPREYEHTLHFRVWSGVGPAWPHQDGPVAPMVGDPHFQRADSAYAKRTADALAHFRERINSPEPSTATEPKPAPWPQPRDGEPGAERPLVSLLFSGGVFRGVYQLGTLNALSELGLTPDVVAGASVGAITSAMIAQALTFKGQERQLRIARLAATYLALDRLILTDRFADFIRGLTLRAGSTRFSLAQADRFFRKYDVASPGQFSGEAREVMAGLERLFWLNPFELQNMVRAMRCGPSAEVSKQLKDAVQKWLERMGVGLEMLGAEPLALLVTEHVLQALPGNPPIANGRAEPFDRFLEQGIYFLATTTNLSMGRLEVLGEQQFDRLGPRPLLLEGLLASSAFPSVFRPRWSWEVMPGSNVRHQYIDGGVMDNLPLDAVAHFLRDSSDARLIAPLPRHKNRAVPHLLFTASLEKDIQPTSDFSKVEKYADNWMSLNKRVKQLRYNKKVDLYAQTQRTLRKMRALRGDGVPFTPIDLEVVIAKPQWLVGTFAFHPMLGFNRDTQAESIAHGCATALATFTDLLHDPEKSQWLEPWGVDVTAVPEEVVRENGALIPGPGAGPGACWFRPHRSCPFSRQSLVQLKGPVLPDTTVGELDGIYRACGRAATHAPRD